MLTLANELQSLTRAVAAEEEARKHEHHRLRRRGMITGSFCSTRWPITAR